MNMVLKVLFSFLFLLIAPLQTMPEKTIPLPSSDNFITIKDVGGFLHIPNPPDEEKHFLGLIKDVCLEPKNNLFCTFPCDDVHYLEVKVYDFDGNLLNTVDVTYPIRYTTFSASGQTVALILVNNSIFIFNAEKQKYSTDCLNDIFPTMQKIIVNDNWMHFAAFNHSNTTLIGSQRGMYRTLSHKFVPTDGSFSGDGTILVFWRQDVKNLSLSIAYLPTDDFFEMTYMLDDVKPVKYIEVGNLLEGITRVFLHFEDETNTNFELDLRP